MTYNEIIPINIEKYAEALNNLIGVDSAYFDGDKDVSAIVEIITLAKKMESIINRQKEEIERLDKLVIEKHTEINRLDEYIQYTRAEAIKEFAERLKETKFKQGSDYFVYAENIDNLVKEMTEGNHD